MRKLLASVGVAISLLALPAATLAAKPSAACGAAPSGFQLVDRDAYWAITVTGFAEGGITVYDSLGEFTAQFEAFAVNYGFSDGTALKEWVLGAQWAPHDKNNDGLLCMKNLPNTPGIPSYSFGVTDNTARGS